MKGFVVYTTYRIEGKDAYVYLYGRQEDGKTFLTRNKYKPYFYVKKTDEGHAIQLAASITAQPTDKRNFSSEPLVKILLDNPKDVSAVRDTLEEMGVETYEADIRFTYRFMMDRNIQGSCEIIGAAQTHTFVDCFYDEPTFQKASFTPNLKLLAIDIETGNKGKNLYCISLVGSDGYNKVLFIAGKNVEAENVQTFRTEKTCLEAFTNEVRKYDPDIITGWSVIDFDLDQLQKFSERNKVPFILGRNDDRTRLKLDKHYFRESTADITGRMVLDGIMLCKISFVKLDDYKLSTAAHQLLGEDKLFTNPDKVKQIEDAYKNDKPLLAAYCRKDSELVLQILAKKKLIDLTVQRSLLTGMHLDRVRASIASLDNVYLRELALRGFAAKTHTYVEKEEQITGGYVMTSQPGIYDYVIVCDFKSLYPSVMRSLNIDPLSFVPGKRLEKSTPEFVVAENGAVFKNTNGIMPDILERLHQAREELRKTKNDVAIYAIKVLMNSFFGSLASPQCRFFSMEVANAITVTCQTIIKRAAQLVRDKGYDVIYGDTDSIFIDLNVNSLEEAEVIGNQIQTDVNEFFKKFIPEHYHRQSYLDLQFEKTFVRFYMPMTRGGEGSKKRYAGLRIVDGKEKIDFTGLEFVRRDWTDLAKEFQLGILDRIFHKQEVTEYIKDFVIQLRAGRYDHLLVYRKALRKDISEYTKTTPQHVKAARKMDVITSNIIEYVLTDDGPQPLGKKTAAIDYEHYISKQLEPIANSVLVFYNTNFRDLVSGNSQKDLFSF